MAETTETATTETTTSVADLVTTKKEEVSATASPSETTEKVVEETSEFDIDLDEKETPSEGSKMKLSKDRFKEVDDDLYSEEEDLDLDEKTHKLLDKVLNRAKEYKTKTNEYKTIAEANQLINSDEHIKTWASVHDLDDEKLLLEVEKAKYQKAGYGEDEAIKMATDDVTELKEESEKLFSKKAKDIRLELRTAIQGRSKEIQSQISQTAKALSLSNAPNPELIAKTIEHLSKTDSFLGLKIGGKSETSKKDFIKPVAEAIKDGSLLKKLQSDPALLAEIGLMVQYKDKFKNAIEKRTPTKQKVKQELSKAPHSSGAAALISDIKEVANASGLKNPGGFR